jgi:hypothetical protein
MPDVTTKLGLKKPLANETVSRAAHNENLDLIDLNAASQADFDAHVTAGVLPHPDGSVTDAKIGSRTANDTTTPSFTGTLTGLFSGLFSLIKGITGKSSALSPPVKTIEQLNTDLNNTLSKSGGTLLGNLTIEKTFEPSIHLKDTNATYYPGLVGEDNNLYVHQKRVSDDGSVNSRVRLDLATGKMYIGAADKEVITVDGGTVGGLKVTAAPSTSNDVARKAEIDTIRSDNTKSLVLEVRTSDPASPELGRMWIRSDV